MLKPMHEEQPRGPMGKGLGWGGAWGAEGSVVHKDKEFELSSKCKGKPLRGGFLVCLHGNLLL